MPEPLSELPPVAIVMGVSGSGKSTLGRALAAQLGWAFIEGDDFHSAANALLDSQIDALERPDDATRIDIALPTEAQLRLAVAALASLS